MTTLRRRVAASACWATALVWASGATAEIKPMGAEFSLNAGVWQGDPLFDTAAVVGGKVGFNMTRVFGVELSYDRVSTDGLGELPTEPMGDQTIQSIALGGRLMLSSKAFVPHVTFGGGFVTADDSTSFATNVGMGATWEFVERFGARADLSAVFAEDAPGLAGYEHFQFTVGVFYRLGGDADIDGDGLSNAKDACPTMPEDKDGFEDTDGCPDTDNDKDGILDADDRCPDVAEDKDGEEDEDGCPDLDKDGDGIPDEADKCVDQPEDKDGFEDTDGCPDTDNDKDGIADAKDKCPDVAENMNGVMDTDGCPEGDADKDGFLDPKDSCVDKPETVNGFKDADGCPDTVPDDLKAVLGILIDARFPKGKAELHKRAIVKLEVAAAALAAHPSARIRIVATAHKSKDDKALSVARAEQVKGYFVGKGLKAARFTVDGAGAKALPENPPKGARNDRIELHLIVGE